MILITLSYWPDNSAQCEQMLEFVFAQNGRQQINGHILLACPPTVDAEMKERIRISAELCFAGVHHLEIRPLTDPVAPKWKNINNVFTQVATHIHKCFRWPFLLLEPDCVPTVRGWLPKLVAAYGAQPKQYFGPRLKIETAGKPDAFLMARCAIYPVNAITDVPPAEAPFEIASAVNVFPKFTISKLIQQTSIVNEADLERVREDAIVVHGDKAGFLRRKLEQNYESREIITLDTEPKLSEVRIPVEVEAPPVAEIIPVNGIKKPKRGRPTLAEIAERNSKLAATFTA